MKKSYSYKVVNVEEKNSTRGAAKRIGKFTLLAEIGLEDEVYCFNSDSNKYFRFEPAIQLVKMDKPTIPGDIDTEVRFGYYTTAEGGTRVWGGQWSLMVNVAQLTALLQGMISQNFFSQNFLRQLGKTIQSKLEK